MALRLVMMKATIRLCILCVSSVLLLLRVASSRLSTLVDLFDLLCWVTTEVMVLLNLCMVDDSC